MHWEDAMKLNFTVLDMIDFTPYIEQADTIDDIRDAVNNAYDNNEFGEEVKTIVEGDTLQGFIFNCITDDDLMDYLHDHYNINFQEEVTYYVTNKVSRNGTNT